MAFYLEKKKENHNSVNFTVLDASAVRHILGTFKSQKFLFTCCVDWLTLNSSIIANLQLLQRSLQMHVHQLWVIILPLAGMGQRLAWIITCASTYKCNEQEAKINVWSRSVC